MKDELFLPLNLQFFSEEGSNEEPGTDPEEAAGPEESQKQEEGTGKATETGKGDDKVFTQKQLNDLIAKEKRSAQESFLKSLGFTDFETAKDGMQKYQEWQEQQKTEAEKQAEELQRYQQEAESERSTRENLEAQLAAIQAGAKSESITDVVVLAKQRVTEDVDLKQAIEQVLEAYPSFKVESNQEGGAGKPNFTPGAPNGTGNTEPSEKEKWLNAFK